MSLLDLGLTRDGIRDTLVDAREAWLRDIDPDSAAAIAATLSPEEAATFNRAYANAVAWREHPALFAAHITRGDAKPYQLWRHTMLMSETMARAGNGTAPHQIHMVASQYGKTTLLQWFIIWLLDRDPTLRVMYVSYDGDRAVEFGGECRDLIRKHRGQLRFQLRADRRARGKWMTPEGGGLYCVGVLGGITGFPQDVILCDDLFKGWETAHSPAQREKVWNVYTSQIRMRVQSNENPIIHVGTRWHEDDIPSRLLSRQMRDPNADRWTVVRLPTFAEAPDPTSTDPLLWEADPLGRAVGELLCPERFPEHEALARKANLAMYLWAAMEQQRPAPLEGNVFKRAWWQLDLEDVFTGKADQWISSWDMKLKEKKSGDYVVGQVWARTGKDLWLVDMLRGQWDQPTTENAVALMMVRYPQIRRHVMENTGNGPEVMEALRTAYPDYTVSNEIAGELGMTEDERAQVQALRRRGMAGIIPNNPKGSKLVRAISCTGAIEAGDVHVARDKWWTGHFLEEMSNFSGYGDAHDDIVDAATQAIRKLHRRGSGKVRTSGALQQTTRAG